MHDPEVYLLDYVPPELRVEVSWRARGALTRNRTLQRLVSRLACLHRLRDQCLPCWCSRLPLPAPQVTRQFCVGFANCMAAAAYLTKQGQLAKPRLLAQMMSIVPGLDKR